MGFCGIISPVRLYRKASMETSKLGQPASDPGRSTAFNAVHAWCKPGQARQPKILPELQAEMAFSCQLSAVSNQLY
jgi:hypothetical protein